MKKMEFTAEYLGNLDMLMPFFGQDDSYLLLDEEGKDVFVEKFENYYGEGLPDEEPAANVDDHGSLFDTEWMDAKVDFSCVSQELDNEFNAINFGHHGSSSTESPAIVSALLGKEPHKVDASCKEPHKVDANINKPITHISENFTSILTTLLSSRPFDSENSSTGYSTNDLIENASSGSTEQHVPNMELQLQLDAYLASAKANVEEDDSTGVTDLELLTVNDLEAAKSRGKRKMSDMMQQGLKVKVKTPEQRQRKRLQNRTAATRYRSKKRNEQEILNAKCQELENENAKLQQLIDNRHQEIQFLKKLVLDVFVKKQ